MFSNLYFLLLLFTITLSLLKSFNYWQQIYINTIFQLIFQSVNMTSNIEFALFRNINTITGRSYPTLHKKSPLCFI